MATGQKTYDAQTAKFLATVSQAMPALTASEMQRWIENPKELASALRVLNTNAVKSGHIIDLDAAPKFPYDHWKVESHQKGGEFEWDPTKVVLHLDPAQKGSGRIEGNKLRGKLADKSPFNANLLDYLLANPELIPESWKQDDAGNTRYIFFWGTIYRDSSGSLYVRYLYWDDGRWQTDCCWLDRGWRSQYPSAVRAR
jgi:hypothetical protein